MVRAMCFSGDDLAVATEDGTVRLWRLPAGEPAEVCPVGRIPLAVSFVAGDPYVAGEDGPGPCRT
jgi:hypothetical protein